MAGRPWFLAAPITAIRERRMDKDDLDEQESLLDIYRRALGMLADTPLGEAAIRDAAK